MTSDHDHDGRGQDLRIEGQATALSSVAHGGENLGTRQTFRTEKVVQPDGEVTRVPVVSGNALRGILRDASAMVTWRMLGCPELPMGVFQLLWQGGNLTKTGTGISDRQLVRLKELVPHIALFGGSGGGVITAGQLMVGKMVPVCQETAHVTPTELHHEHMPSLWDLVQTERFTRRDDSKRSELAPAIAGALGVARAAGAGDAAMLAPAADSDDAPADETLTVAVGDGDGDGDGRAVTQMRYGTQTIAAGTRLHWWIALHDVTDLQRAQFRAALDWWAAHGAVVGGRGSSGHGRLQMNMSHWSTAGPATTVGDGLAVGDADQLATHGETHRDEILEVLGWMA